MAEDGSDKIHHNSLALIDFTLDWQADGIRHRDSRVWQKVNMWRDIFPAGLDTALLGKSAGATLALDYPAGSLGPRYDPSECFTVRDRDFDREMSTAIHLEPDYGRFFPRGVLHDVRGIFKEDRRPFRCLDHGGGSLTVDLNHPFAGRDARLTATVRRVADASAETGGRCTAWGEVVTDGPGIQARSGSRPTEFFFDGAFARVVEDDDAEFYARPRMTVHLDETARGIVAATYGEFFKDGMAVLDLMSSLHSHLPETLDLARVAGLGLNQAELEANPRLTDHRVHDLNAVPRLPYDDCSFDAVVCASSVEYLTAPLAVFTDLARVLKPGGFLAVTFSNRWFPPKVVRLWREIHPFERVGLVLEYFLASGLFIGIETRSVQGFPRPADDPYADREALSDPVFAVIGHRRA